MVDIADYEKRGDLSAPFELTRRAEREQRDAEELQKHVQTLMDGFPPCQRTFVRRSAASCPRDLRPSRS